MENSSKQEDFEKPRNQSVISKISTTLRGIPASSIHRSKKVLQKILTHPKPYIPEIVKEITADQIGTISMEEKKIDFVSKKRVKIQKIIKWAVVGIIFCLIAGPIIYFLTRPKEDVFFKRHEEFGPCVTQKEQCFQDLIIYESGKIKYEGKINKEFSLRLSKIRKIKKLITNANLTKEKCEETPILMEYKLTHELTVNGLTTEIKSPGCEDELEAMDLEIDKIIDNK